MDSAGRDPGCEMTDGVCRGLVALRRLGNEYPTATISNHTSPSIWTIHGDAGGGILWNGGFQPLLYLGNDDKSAAGSRNSIIDRKYTDKKPKL